MFRRKIYDKLLSWKKESDGKTALLLEGARRVGKSTLVEAFGKNEYESCILIDFSIASKDIVDLFDDMSDLNYFFLQLQKVFISDTDALSHLYERCTQRAGHPLYSCLHDTILVMEISGSS